MSDEPTNGKPIEEQHPRQITDITCPWEVWRRPDLRPLAKFLYAEIRSLSRGPRGCWATNAFLGKFMLCTDRYIRELLQELHACELLAVERFPNSPQGSPRRILRALRPWDTDPTWNDRTFSPPTGPGGGGTGGDTPELTSQARTEGHPGTLVPPTPEPEFRQRKDNMRVRDSGTPPYPPQGSLSVQASGNPDNAAAASLYIYRLGARYPGGLALPPEDSLYIPQQQHVTRKPSASPSEQENVTLAVLGSPHEKNAASNVGEQAMDVSSTARETERTLAGGECIEPLGLVTDQPPDAGSRSVGGDDCGMAARADDGAVTEPTVAAEGCASVGEDLNRFSDEGGETAPQRTEAKLDQSYRRLMYGREKTDAAEAGRLGGVVGVDAPGVDAHAVADAPSVAVTDQEEHEGAAALLEAWAGGALSAGDAWELTREVTCARVLAVTGRAEERPEGMRVGFVVKCLRDGLSVTPPARASPPAVAHRREAREVENGVEAGRVTAPPIGRREVPTERSAEEVEAFAAMRAHLLSNMAPGELAWVSQRRQERRLFGKQVPDTVGGLTSVAGVLGGEELKALLPHVETEHEPRDRLPRAA